MKNVDKFKKSLEEIQIHLSELQLNQFLRYYEVLMEWNCFMNLTTITEFDDVVDKHFIDSLSLFKTIDLSEDLHVLDVGTGAGFPGIPLKIVFPNLQIVLLDSLNKRIKFLDEVISELRLDKIETIHGRAEDFGKDKDYRSQFDLVVSRAVAHLAALSEYCLPYVKNGGAFIPYKSGMIEGELNESKKAVDILGGKIEKVETFVLPNTDIIRSFVVIKKIKETPKTYPRNAGKPAKEPIL